MMKLGFAAVAALLVAGCATSPTQQAEIGYSKGSLGYAAMVKGDWSKAEAQLQASPVDAEDPAKLLNLAQVYRVTDRESAARDLYGRVLDRENLALVSSTGEVFMAHDIARAALTETATASRN